MLLRSIYSTALMQMRGGHEGQLTCCFPPLKEDEVMPAKFEDDLIWVAADTPLSDSAFLSNKIKDLCGDLPIFWLRPTYSSSK